jgi:pilus assembly protein CpaF
MSLLRRTISNPGQPGGQKPGGGSGDSNDKDAVEARRQQALAAQRAQQQQQRGSGAMPPKKGGDNVSDLKSRVQNRLMAELDPATDLSRTEEVRVQIQSLFNQILAEENMLLNKSERDRLFENVVADILGLGPLDALMKDDSISEVMVNGPKMIFIEVKGHPTLSGVTFENDEHVMRVIDRIVAPLGRRVDESSPLVDARLKDGSRVHVVIRPIALCGPTITRA